VQGRKLEDVLKQDGFSPGRAVANLKEMKVAEGETLAVIGPNGSGTTSLFTLAFVVIIVNAADPSRRTPRERVQGARVSSRIAFAHRFG
jgi:ABC-type branched-subunit amino acid transport system ATPase component